MAELPDENLNEKKSSRKWIYISAALCIVAAGVVAYILSDRAKPQRPDPKADVILVARYVASRDFLQLSFDQQRDYCYALRMGMAQLKPGKSDGKLTDEQYEFSRAAAWMGGKLEHLREYEKLETPQAKTQYIDKLLKRRKEKNATSAATTGPATAPTDSTQTASSDDTRYSTCEPVKQIVSTWSKRRRADWDEFINATRARKTELRFSTDK